MRECQNLNTLKNVKRAHANRYTAHGGMMRLGQSDRGLCSPKRTLNANYA